MEDNRGVNTSIDSSSLTSALRQHIEEAIRAAGGWLAFDRFMELALYTPGLGYYANGTAKFGTMPQSGSDFVTAPELSPLFGWALAQQVREALDASGTDEIWEFGAGTGALARQLLEALGSRVKRYTIVDLSGSLRARQKQALDAFGDQVAWAEQLPDAIEGVIVGNEVLDAMPVKLVHRLGGEHDGVWHERGVVLAEGEEGEDGKKGPGFAWEDRVTDLRPPVDGIPGPQDYLTELQPQGEAFIRTIADRLKRGAAIFIDYGFPEGEFFHPQRHMGTLVCHRAHMVDFDPLVDVGLKDITAHVNFTGMALAAQDAGMQVLGYTNQAHFLLNCGIAEEMQKREQKERSQAAKLVMEHEMGELFKVLMLGVGEPWLPRGFSHGDRTHRL
ncbi:class I SAM-dependent methyltransferase [Diaphorobacter ruginosibacter]|nr:SAM-dependent methyltransferase [Diaphorobacter ruginosibacter]